MQYCVLLAPGKRPWLGRPLHWSPEEGWSQQQAENTALGKGSFNLSKIESLGVLTPGEVEGGSDTKGFGPGNCVECGEGKSADGGAGDFPGSFTATLMENRSLWWEPSAQATNCGHGNKFSESLALMPQSLLCS